MKVFIVAHNVNSAGITSQTINLINELKHRKEIKSKIILPDHSGFASLKEVNCKNLVIRFVPYPRNKLIRILLRIFYDLFLVPFLIVLDNPNSVLALANYLPTPIFFRKKIILIRHPYLLNNSLSRKLSFGPRIKEVFSRGLLRLTLFTTDLVIVQSEYMKKSFEHRFTNVDILILPNPLSNAFKNNKDSSKFTFILDRSSHYLFYPSRFYPHKNHAFIKELIDEYQSELNVIKVKFIVTVDNRLLDEMTLAERKKYSGLINSFTQSPYDKFILNIGEVDQDKLSYFYQNSDVLFFPSKEETFGNGLIEAMYFSLPIIVPNLSYSRTICDHAGVYYDPDNVKDAFRQIEKIILNDELQLAYRRKSKERFSNFIYTDEWIDKLSTRIMSL